MLLIYLDETDGDIIMENIPENISGEEIRDRVKKLNLTIYDYAIVSGTVLKSFASKNLSSNHWKI